MVIEAQSSKTHKVRSARRRAAAVVEFAVVSPILITLVFGIIEFGYAFMVRQMVTNAAREGAREAAVQTTVNHADINVAVQDSLVAITNLTVPDSAIDITHWCKDAFGTADFTETVQVTIPYSDISLLGDYFSWISFSDIVAIMLPDDAKQVLPRTHHARPGARLAPARRHGTHSPSV